MPIDTKLLLKLKFFFVLILISNLVYADFGKQCNNSSIGNNFQLNLTLQKADSKNDDNSILSYVVNLINPSCIFNSDDYDMCEDDQNDRMTICIAKDSSQIGLDNLSDNFSRESDMSKITYDKVTILNNREYFLSEISSNPIFKSNHFKNLKLIGDIRTIKNGNDTIENFCVSLNTLYGVKPIFCKNIVYKYDVHKKDGSTQETCNFISTACSRGSSSASLFEIGFSGKVMECISDTLNLVFFDPSSCDSTYSFKDKNDKISNISIRPFAEIQSMLRIIVFSIISIYLIFLGINCMLDPSSVRFLDFSINFVKIIFVIYFSIGFSWINVVKSKEYHSNGITEIVLPTFISFTIYLSNMMVNAVNRYSNDGNPGLCYFDVNKYPKNLEYYAIFDMLDCFLNTYLGTNIIMRNDLTFYRTVYSSPGSMIVPPDPAGDNRPSQIKARVSIPIISELFHVFFTKSGIFIAICFAGVVFVSVLIYARLVLSLILSVIFIYIFAYMAPIIVPFALFNRTYEIFKRWVSLLLSTMIQPALILAFGILILSIYNKNLFNKCSVGIYEDSATNIRKFEILIPADYKGDCLNSPGFIMYYNLDVGGNWKNKQSAYISSYPSLNLDESSKIPIIRITILIYILYFFVEKINVLVSGLTGGIDFSGMLTNPINEISALRKSITSGIGGMVQKAMNESLSSAKGKSGSGKSGGSKNTPIKKS